LRVADSGRSGRLIGGIGRRVRIAQIEFDQPLRHSVSTPLNAPAHDVWVSRNSRLWSVLHEQLGNGDTIQVNSRHHQAVGLVGAGLEVSALAPDGIIEGIERPGARFCLAVQWHPENLANRRIPRALRNAGGVVPSRGVANISPPGGDRA
jgi:gamma-glutamyl-gamma-aminobutyrate hydrolase PuuD